MNRVIHLGEKREVFKDADLLEAGPVFELDGVEFDPAQKGYTLVHNYALYFWRPYLGNTAFALWELLLSFCYGDCDVAYPSISRLARMITNSDHSRAVVMGRRRARVAQSRQTQGGTPRRRYPGALEVLRRERLVQVTHRGHGPTTRYTFRVLKALPLLRPEQVARLSPHLQRDHVAWMERYGIDPLTYRQALENAPSSQQQAPAAPDLTPAVPDPTPVGSHTSGDGLRSSGPARCSTNNPQEEDVTEYWWKETAQELRPQLQHVLFQMCFPKAKVFSFHDGVLAVQAPSAAARDLLEHRLAMAVRRTLIAVSNGQVKQVRFLGGESEGEEQCAH